MSRPRRGGPSSGAADRRGPSRRGATAPATEQLATLRVEGIAGGGDGVARLDGMATFVPRTAPGDVVQAAVAVHGRMARGRMLQLLEASPVRVEPGCPHYAGDLCGGCQLQHLAPEAQQAARTRLVAEALARIGKRRVDPPPLVTGAEWGYRGRITVALRRRGGRWRGGFHPYDDPSRIFDLRQCAIADPRLMHVWERLRALLAVAALPEADTLRLGLRLAPRGLDVAPAREAPTGEGPTGVVLVVEGGERWAASAAWGREVLGALPEVLACWWRPEGRPEAICVAERAGEATAVAMAFAQVHAPLADRLRDEVARVVLASGARTVVDAYAGVGRLAVRLQAAGVGGVAIEADRVGADAARTALARPAGTGAGRPPWRVETALVEEALTAALPAEAVVVNPPRRGVAPAVCDQLEAAATRGTRLLLYVSCDPATLARDLVRLPGWRIADMTCFDLFPQTAHVETVCVLQPEGA
jgi:23S rRNA (uracil1939-C5)-methyltransferase